MNASLLLLSIACVLAQSPPDRTIFQTGGPYSPPVDIASDVAVVYGTWGDFNARINEWRAQGYETSFMTGVSWGGYGDYYGEGDAFKAAEVQTRKDGSLRMHGGNVGYNVPTEGYIEYLKQYITPAVDAGVRAIYLEEPEFWADTGWSQAFKGAWQKYYGEPWQAPDSSVDAQYKASCLKYEMYYHALAEVFKFAKQRAREQGREIECHVPTHSLINYAHWRIVSPESHLMDIPECDGYIAQVWTGTARTPNRYRNVLKERTFEAAYFEYGSAWAMVRPTGRKVWFLHDPIEDNPNHTWADYEKNYEATVAASLLWPGVQHYEVMPWPDRVWTGQYPRAELEKKPSGEAVETEREGIPADYATELLTVMNALNEMGPATASIAGEPGVGIIVSDSLMFQRAEPAPSDAAMGHFYGIAMPLLKAGMLAQPVQLETLHAVEDLAGLRVLFLSYEGQKPLKPDYHEVVAQWVEQGGLLVVVDDNTDPYNAVKAWWNNNGETAATPRDALLSRLGVKPEDAGARVKAGSGAVLLLAASPTALSKREDGPEIILSALETMKGEAARQSAIMMERENYTIIAGLDETGRDETHGYAGRFIDLFDPALGYVVRPEVKPGEQRLLRKVPVNHPAVPEVLAASARVAGFAVEGNTVRFRTRGPAGTTCRVVLCLPNAPLAARLDGTPMPNPSWQKGRKLARMEFPNAAKWQQVELDLPAIDARVTKLFGSTAQTESCVALAEAYFTGDGIPQDIGEAWYWYSTAAQRGDAEAAYMLGEMLSVPLGRKQDTGRALEWYTRAADAGHVKAQLHLAWVYTSGKGAPVNLEEAARWNRKAADQGSPEGMMAFGRNCYAGQGVPQDAAQAFAWFQKAAEQESPEGQMMVAWMYFNGNGVEKNLVQAYAWATKCEEGVEGGNVMLERIRAQMTPEEIAEAEKLAAQ